MREGDRTQGGKKFPEGRGRPNQRGEKGSKRPGAVQRRQSFLHARPPLPLPLVFGPVLVLDIGSSSTGQERSSLARNTTSVVVPGSHPWCRAAESISYRVTIRGRGLGNKAAVFLAIEISARGKRENRGIFQVYFLRRGVIRTMSVGFPPGGALVSAPGSPSPFPISRPVLQPKKKKSTAPKE